jgi:diaminopimelate decarboxylase
MIGNVQQTSKVRSISEDPPRLQPRIHPAIQSFLKEKDLLFRLIENYGSPLNIIFPQNMHENISEFQNVYKKHNLRGRIYYTSKPCKSSALIREAAGFEIGIDVSSAGSLKKALDCVVDADRIGATGPKSKTYIANAVAAGVLINIDNIDELKEIVLTHQSLEKSQKTRIMVRIADTGHKTENSIRTEDTSFGIKTSDMDWVFNFLEDHKEILEFHGFSYHASMANDAQRIDAMENQISLTFEAIKRGFRISKINIGGGFRVSYAESNEEWSSYLDCLKSSVLGKIPTQIWNNGNLGYRVENGAIRGDGAFIHHAPVYTKAQELDRWLDFRLPAYANVKFSDIVRDSLFQLQIEPGRSLIDQCGITIGRVSYTKKSIRDEILIGMEMNSSNIHSDKFKMLTEPVVIPKHDGIINENQDGVYYVGNLCMTNDMLRYNKTYPYYMPEADDLIIFPNTAAYMMDFTESEILMQPLAKKIAVTNLNDTWVCTPDEDYRSAV